MNLTKSNVVLAVLAAALAVPTWLQLQQDRATFVDVGRVPLLFDGFTAENVGRITLRVPKAEQPPAETEGQQPKVAYDELVFVRNGENWTFGSGDLRFAPVLKERIEAEVLQHLRTIRFDRQSLVAESATPEQLVRYGLDDAQAMVVEARDAQGQSIVADLLVGLDSSKGEKGTEAVRGVFVRKSDRSDVILYEPDRPMLRLLQTDVWLDKTLARITPDKVQRFSIKNAASGGTFTFGRVDGKSSWTVITPPVEVGAVRQAEVDTLLQRLVWIAAQDFRLPLQRANLPQLGLQPPQLELDLLVRDGNRDRRIQLAVGNRVEGKNEFYLTCNESQFLMTWSAGTVTPFELDVKSQLFDPLPPK